MKTQNEVKHTPGRLSGVASSTKTRIHNCGCHSSYNPGEGEHTILFCHLHAAAPELLKAVLAVQEGLRDVSIKWAKPRQADSDPYHKANTLMCAAIAKAEGC